MSRHVNIPIFIPHLGCPNTCVFCNQRTISGRMSFDISQTRAEIENALSTVPEGAQVEIAFFGGSFTGIERDLMVSLLELAYSYVKSGRVDSVRCSTRPDYIDSQVLDILERYGVRTIELGLQSADETVLLKSRRGHSFAAEELACRQIVERGFTLVGQMMIGLPGADIDTELRTAEFIIRAGASAARVYPTVVFRDTELCRMYARGEYEPLTLDDAVARAAAVVRRLREGGVRVIRVGLCSSENLASDATYAAGPNHPAIGELCENRIYYERITEAARSLPLNDRSILKVTVSRGDMSKAVGQRKRNKLLLKETLGVLDVVFLESDGLGAGEISVRAEEGEKKCS